jgi:hypothetical protein
MTSFLRIIFTVIVGEGAENRRQDAWDYVPIL